MLGLVSDLAGAAASRISPELLPSTNVLPTRENASAERLQHQVPKNLDLHYITDRIIGMAQLAEAPVPTRVDPGRDSTTNAHDSCENDLPPSEETDMTTGRPLSPTEPSQPLSPQAVESSATKEEKYALPKAKRKGNCPATLSTFLGRRHPNRFLLVNLSEQDADDRALLLLNRQIIRFRWKSPCLRRSETPSLPQLFEICYALHAYLSLDKDRVALIHCSNGKTRTAIVVACYLKFAGLVRTAMDGFRLFCTRRCPDLDPDKIADQIPPSLQTFFRNFTDGVDLGGFGNSTPLLLRAVALQGVPVDDKPCIDIWDTNQNLIYSSHPVWKDDVDENNGQKPLPSQWVDEEGFYRIDKAITGDFVLLCRFGGPYADDTDDPSTVLFRYANHSGFVCAAPYEFPKGKVDMMRRYGSSFDDEDFLLTLMFESSVGSSASTNATSEENDHLCKRCSESSLPSILEGLPALERGWEIIADAHAARPAASDVKLITDDKTLGCSDTAASLMLQLTNHDVNGARKVLVAKLSSVPKVSKKRPFIEETNANDGEERPQVLQEVSQNPHEQASNDRATPELKSETACRNILRIIDDTDFGIDIEWVDDVESDTSTDWEIVNRRGQRTEPEDPVALYGAPIMFPKQGDVVNAFGDYNVTQKFAHYSCRKHSAPPLLGSRPKMYMWSRKRRRPNFNEDASTQQRRHTDKSWEKKFRSQSSIQNHKNRQKTKHTESHLDNEDPAAAMELLLKLNHTGITFQGLLDLQRASRGWTGLSKRTSNSEIGKGQVAAEGGAKISRSGSTRSAVSEIAGRIENGGIQNISQAKNQIETHKKITHSSSVGPVLRDKEPVHATGTETAAVVGASNVINKDLGSVDPTALYNLAMQSLGPGASSLATSSEAGGLNSKVLPDLAMHSTGDNNTLSGPSREWTPAEAIAALHSLAMQRLGPNIMAGQAHSNQVADAAKQSDDENAANKASQPESQKSDKDGTKGGNREIPPKDGSTAEEASKTDGTPSKDNEDPPLKEDPEYKKYFKMLDVGLPMGAVKNALQRDGKDPSIMDLDPEKSLKSQTEPPKDDKDEETPLKEDPEYSKYFKMLDVGLPMGAVKNALQRDGKDPSIMDLDPEKSLKSQTETPAKDNSDDPPLKDDPDYAKYFKMLKMGLPMGAVKNALQRDGKDPSIMDLDHNKSVKSQTGGGDKEDDGPPLKEDPEYEKYFKMLAVGLPIGAVKQAMQRDGKDPSILDLDHNRSVKSQMSNDGEDTGVPLKDDPEYAKYFKMLQMGLPMGAVKNALQRDGKDPSIMDLDHNKSVKSQTEGDDNEDDGPPLKEDPEYEKYFKMLRLKLPMGAVKQAMQRDGKDPSIMDLDHNRSVKSQMSNDADDNGVPLKDDPEYSKYFKMLKMGLPMGAVKNALQRDEKDTSIMDLDPNKSVAFQLNSRTRRKTKKSQKKKVRRKKIYWTPIDPTKVNEDSIWSLVKGTVAMDQLKYDMTEFENLFTESSNPADKKKKESSAGDKKPAQKKSVQVIEGKRGMNGGIILARLKIEYSKIAEMVDKMENGNLDDTQLRALKEFLPNDEERPNLEVYLKKGETSEKAMAEALAAMSECEKYMVAMMKVKKAAAKFDCMLFKTQFQSRYDEITEAREIVKNACEEMRASERLRKMMAMILTVVNEINTGGTGNIAIGFSLDALLKLSEAKAFDKKTSVLHYLVKIVRENDKTLVELKSDIPSTIPAQGVILEGLASDIKALSQELSSVHETVKEDADRLEESGEIPNMSVVQLSEQRTEVRQIDGQQHYNKIDHLTGRTPMEKFSLRSQEIVKEALDSITELKENYAKLLEYFGEDESMPSDAFFGTINKFVVSFETAVQEVEEAEKKRQKEKLRAAAKAAALPKKNPTTKAAPSNAPDKKSSKKTIGHGKSNTNVNPSNKRSDIAADAAATMQSPKKGTESTKTDGADAKGDIFKSPPNLPVGAGGIAAAAAAAAALRRKEMTESGNLSSSKTGEPPLAIGGLGIAAAAAAAATLRATEKDNSTEPASNINEPTKLAFTYTEDKKVMKSPPNLAAGGRGIAAAAAAVAALRSKGKDLEKKGSNSNSFDSGFNESPPAVGGIAAAAALRSKPGDSEKEGAHITESNEVVNESPGAVASGDIAASAAAAAADLNSKRKNEKVAGSNVTTSNGSAGGGGITIAGTAAAAGALRFTGKDPGKEGSNVTSSDIVGDASLPAVDGVGIAAAAAAAAALRSKRKNEKVLIKEENNGMIGDDTVEGGSSPVIAAVPRPAAKDSEREGANVASSGVVGNGPLPTIVDGGIEAADAAAATLGSKTKEDSVFAIEDFDAPDGNIVADGGSIAAAAAAAASLRSKMKKSDKMNLNTASSDVVDEGSILAVDGAGTAASASALRSKTQDAKKVNANTGSRESVNDEALPAVLVADVTNAAAAKLGTKGKETEKEDSKTTLSDTNVDESLRLVGEVGTVATLQSELKVSEKPTSKIALSDACVDESFPTVGGGGIAAAAAAAAALRSKRIESESTNFASPDESTSNVGEAGTQALYRLNPKVWEEANPITTSSDGDFDVSLPVVDSGGTASAVLSNARDLEKENRNSPSSDTASSESARAVDRFGVAAAATAAAALRSTRAAAPGVDVGKSLPATLKETSKTKASEKEVINKTSSNAVDDGGIASGEVKERNDKASENEDSFSSISGNTVDGRSNTADLQLRGQGVDMKNADASSSDTIGDETLTTAAATTAALRFERTDSDKESASTFLSTNIVDESTSPIIRGGSSEPAAAGEALGEKEKEEKVSANNGVDRVMKTANEATLAFTATSSVSDQFDTGMCSSDCNDSDIPDEGDGISSDLIVGGVQTNVEYPERGDEKIASLENVPADNDNSGAQSIITNGQASPSEAAIDTINPSSHLEEHGPIEMEEPCTDIDSIDQAKSSEKMAENGFQKWIRSLNTEKVPSNPGEQDIEVTASEQVSDDQNDSDEGQDEKSSQEKVENPFQSWFKGFG